MALNVPSDQNNLTKPGIDHVLAAKTAQQFALHWETSGDVAIAHTERWIDREAIKAFRSALQFDVDRLIVPPGAGDRPLWTSNEVGKTIGKFHSFAFAANLRISFVGI